MSRVAYQTLIWTANRLAHVYLKSFIRSLLKPIDYTRTREIPVLLELSDILKRQNEPLRILDIGSPQILSLALCSYSQQWEVVYVNKYSPELIDITGKSAQLELKNLSITHADITDATTLKSLGKFDVIFSCSVFEHIYPEFGGDAIAATNISNLLRDDGMFIISVPFYTYAFNEYKKGDVYAVNGNKSRKIFFQRFYDENTLEEQIIKPTKLKLVAIRYIGERFYHPNEINKRMAFLIDFKSGSLLLGRFYRYLTAIFMCESDDFRNLKKPYLAFCSLKKTTKA